MITLTDILTVIGCIAALAGGFIVIFASNPIRSLLGLFLTSIALGILFLLLGGSLVAMAQLVVYAGAVLMLFLFVVRYFVKKLPFTKLQNQLPVALIVVIIILMQILVPMYAVFSGMYFTPDYIPPDPKILGQTLFFKYVYAFELITVLLLVSVVGAIYLARGESRFDEGGEDE